MWYYCLNLLSADISLGSQGILMKTLIIPANDKLLSTGMSSPRKTIWARYGTCVTSGSSRHSSVSPHPPSALHHMPFSCPLLVSISMTSYVCLSSIHVSCLHSPLFPSLISPVHSTPPPPWGRAEPVSVRGGRLVNIISMGN